MLVSALEEWLIERWLVVDEIVGKLCVEGVAIRRHVDVQWLIASDPLVGEPLLFLAFDQRAPDHVFDVLTCRVT